MLGIEIKRTIKQGVINFWRNGWVSLATILVMVLALFVLGALFFSNVLLTSALSRLEEKVDISVYFNTSAPEEDVLALKSSLDKMAEVKSVEYVSRDDALREFRERHRENALLTQALEELGSNPLGASLNIKAQDPRQYEAISRFLESDNFKNIVSKINFRQNQSVIEKLTAILKASRALGFGITLALSAIAILVAFNTIRLAIYTSRDEISIMRLVGASNAYIRGPFIMEGVLHGLIASLLTMLAFWPIVRWLGPKADRFFGGPDLYDYYLSNFFSIFLILLVAGVILGVISSFIATQRYLKEQA
ncbi:MAG: permease-like cell division protein FtsX [bacterium]|nr:permease-like cell division protein FtsX [bacterium]